MTDRPPTPISVVITNADGIADNTEPAMVVLEITRREIESGNIASALERLLVLSDTRENTLLYRESLLFQVEGYDHDPRELPEIPEVRAFFSRLVQEWPHWLWFIHRGIGALGLLMSLLCEVKIHRQPGGAGYGTEFRNSDELYARFTYITAHGEALFRAFGIPEAEATASVNSAIDEIFRGE